MHGVKPGGLGLQRCPVHVPGGENAPVDNGLHGAEPGGVGLQRCPVLVPIVCLPPPPVQHRTYGGG